MYLFLINVHSLHKNYFVLYKFVKQILIKLVKNKNKFSNIKLIKYFYGCCFAKL